MAKVIEQVVKFPVSAAELFDIYLDSEKHAAAIQSTATVTREVGGAFTAHGMITGRILEILPDRMIVQTWRANGFHESDPDSVPVLTFCDVEGGAELAMTHVQSVFQRDSSGRPGPAHVWDPGELCGWSHVRRPLRQRCFRAPARTGPRPTDCGRRVCI